MKHAGCYNLVQSRFWVYLVEGQLCLNGHLLDMQLYESLNRGR